MKALAVLIGGLIVLIQYPLWLGKGGVLRVWEVTRQIEAQRHANALLLSRNMAVEHEVADLKDGVDAVEERARNELGMIKSDEVFVQVVR